jgi:MerR family transcriptional regulator, light-induced transcriptional regulator
MSRLERHEAIAGAARCGADLDLLRTVLERHVIPQLAGRPVVEAAAVVEPAVVDALTARAVAQDLAAAQALFDGFIREGGRVDVLVSACAARLGQAWDADEVTFVEVTVGLGVLASLVSIEREGSGGGSARGLVLLTTAPGEQHTLGLQLVAQALRRDGWSVDVEPGLEPTALARRVATSRLDAVGFTVSRAALLPSLATALRAVRASSASTALMVGGPLALTSFAQTHGARALEGPGSAVEWLREVRCTGRRGSGRAQPPR